MAKLLKLKKTWNQMSIKWKIFTYLFGFCVIVLAFLWVFQIVFLSDFYRGIKVGQVKAAASNIESEINSIGVAEAVSDASMKSDACVFVVSTDGTVVATTNSYRRCSTMTALQVSYIRNELTDSNDFTAYYNVKGGVTIGGEVITNSPFNNMAFGNDQLTTLVYATEVVQTSTNQTLLVVITTEITPVTATVSTLRIQLIYVTIGMIVLAFLLAWLISRNVSKPIEGINEKAKILAKGNYDVIFDSTGYKEINELSATLTSTSKELAKVETLRKELIANISHDLRTPLTLIAGYAEAMRDLPEENNYENAQIIIEEANRLSSLVNDALNISKMQSGVLSLEISEFSLTKMSENVVHRMAELVKKDGYHLEFKADQDVMIAADENKLSQVLYNLLINAINYTGEDKLVTVTQTVKDNEVTIAVHDSGPGVDEENLPYIWDRYYKVDKVHKRAVTGTGLGLSIVKSLVTLHKGECGVETSKDHGSTFYFKLKIKELSSN